MTQCPLFGATRIALDRDDVGLDSAPLALAFARSAQPPSRDIWRRCTSLAAASRAWEDYRDDHELGSSDSPDVRVINFDTHEVVARVSYNGRVWVTVAGPEVCVYSPVPRQACPECGDRTFQIYVQGGLSECRVCLRTYDRWTGDSTTNSDTRGEQS